MPTKSELRAMAWRLRHARTQLAPIEVAERVQHTIVRLEQILLAPLPLPTDTEKVFAEAEQLAAYCDRLSAAK